MFLPSTSEVRTAPPVKRPLPPVGAAARLPGRGASPRFRPVEPVGARWRRAPIRDTRCARSRTGRLSLCEPRCGMSSFGELRAKQVRNPTPRKGGRVSEQDCSETLRLRRGRSKQSDLYLCLVSGLVDQLRVEGAAASTAGPTSPVVAGLFTVIQALSYVYLDRP